MARITVEDCLKQIPNRFKLVMLASKRARQLSRRADDARLDWDNDKATVLALREIAAGIITEANVDQVNEHTEVTEGNHPATTDTEQAG